MFPNVRLLIAALLTSVVALSGGFGVFAALRVNRDPLSRFPADTVRLQLVANPLPPAAWGAPFGGSSRLTDAQSGGAAADTPVSAAVRRETNEPVNAWATAKAEPATLAKVPQQASLPPIAAPTPARTTPVVAIEPAPTPQAPAVQFVPGMSVQATDKPGEPAKAAPPAVAATEPTGGQAQAVAQPADITASVPENPAPVAKVLPKRVGKLLPSTARKTARGVVVRRRIASGKRIVRTAPRAPVTQNNTQNSTFQEPIFQTSPHTKVETRAGTNDKSSVASGPFLGPQ
jgi:hypothetical protein